MTTERRTFAGPHRSLDGSEVEEIRRLRDQGRKLDDLATVYGVSRRTVIRYLKPDGHSEWPRARVASVVRLWARRFAIDATPMEVDALVSDIVRVRWREDDRP